MLTDSTLDGFPAPSVTIDNDTASRRAVELLLDQGHQRTAFMHGGLRNHTDKQRHESYSGTLENRGLAPLAFDGDLTMAGGAACADAILTSDASAVLVSNNMMTVGLRKELARRSIEVPADLSLLGSEDMDWYDLADPGITTTAQPTREIGRLAAETMINRLDGQAASPQHVLESTVKSRASIGPPRSRP